MKRSSIARTALAVSGALLLACTTGCDQGGGQALAQLTEAFNTRVAEKDKQLTEARNAQQLAVSQKSELEGKLAALQAELDKARASGPSTGGNGPTISAKEISTQVALALDPVIRSAVKDLAKSLPAPVAPNPGPSTREPATPPRTTGTGEFDLSPPKGGPNRRPQGGGGELTEKPPVTNGTRGARDDGPIDIPAPRGGNKDKDEKVRPTTSPKDKIPIEFPPLAPR